MLVRTSFMLEDFGMNRALVFGIAIFFAVVGIALVGGEKNVAVAGHGCHGCSGCDGGCDGGCSGPSCNDCGCRGGLFSRLRNRCCGQQTCCDAPACCAAPVAPSCAGAAPAAPAAPAAAPAAPAPAVVPAK